MREQMKELEAEINKKDEKYQELLDIYNQLPKNINRSVYTNRILESVKQIKKQKVEINKVIFFFPLSSFFITKINNKKKDFIG